MVGGILRDAGAQKIVQTCDNLIERQGGKVETKKSQERAAGSGSNNNNYG